MTTNPPDWFASFGIPERFTSKIEFGDPSECWPWTAARYSRGYGVYRINGRNVTASRWLYEQIHGAAEELCVCHHCDNPPCCNPAHLYLGTKADNNRDMFEKNRRPAALGEQNGKSLLTEEIVRKVRSEYRGRRGECKKLCEKYGVHKNTMLAVLHGRTWKHVDSPTPHNGDITKL